MNGLLVRVAADQSSGSGHWNGPVDVPSGAFTYVPIPEAKPNRAGHERPYESLVLVLGRAGVSLPSHFIGRRMHLDPDFEHLTYGNRGSKGKQISNGLGSGDLLVFYSGLMDIQTQKLVYAIIGLYLVERITMAKDLPEWEWHRNAHTRRELAELERRRSEINRKLLLIKELRAVAPLLSTLDDADRALQDLKSVTMLISTAAVERASAESGLSAATENASIAAAEVTRQLQKLDGIKVDAAVLAVGPAVKRLAASAESIDQHRRDIADAKIDVSSETHQMAVLASRIAPSSIPDEVLKKAPTKTQRAVIEKLLRSLDLARQALDNHRDAVRQSAESHHPIADVIPSAASRAALRIA
jgi:hypothetical protein